jgi:hypothetical protein
LLALSGAHHILHVSRIRVSVPWGCFVAAVLTSSPFTSRNTVEVSEAAYCYFARNPELTCNAVFYQARSCQAIKKNHSKKKSKFSTWHYVNVTGRGLPWDCEKV